MQVSKGTVVVHGQLLLVFFFTQPGQCCSCGVGMALDSDSITLQYSASTNFHWFATLHDEVSGCSLASNWDLLGGHLWLNYFRWI